MLPATVGVLGQQGASAVDSVGHDAFKDIDLDDFLKLLITEMSNQDPLEPMDNNQILEQISQIREIESNSRLTETLESVQLGQAMATASSLIGRTIKAITQDGTPVHGEVDRVSVVDGKPKLHIGEQQVELSNVSEILAENTP